MLKKIVCAFFISLLFISSFAETVTLNVVSQVSDARGVQTGAFADALLKKFNVKINLVAQADETTDIIIFDSLNSYQNACNKNMLLDLEASKLLKKKAPELYKNFKSALMKNRFLDSPDKKMHGFGQGVGKSKELKPFVYTWLLRSDLYEQIGRTKVNQLLDLPDLFTKMKELEPFDSEGNENAAYFVEGAGTVSDFVKAYYGYDSFDFGFYDSETGDFLDCLKSDGPYLTCLSFLYDLNQKQLLTFDEAKKNNVFAKLCGAEQNFETVCPSEARPIAYCQGAYGGEQIWAIGQKSQNVELCLSILNWFTVPAGYQKLTDESCKLNALTWSYDSQNPVTDEVMLSTNYRKCFESLYQRTEPSDELTKHSQALLDCIQTKSLQAITAKDNEEYDQIIADMLEEVKTYDYEKWTEYSKTEAKKRFQAEKLL